MQEIRTTLGNHRIANCHAGINWGLQGDRLATYYRTYPAINRLPMLNHQQYGNKFECVKAVQAVGVPVPESLSSIPTGETDGWIMKPYYSLGGRDISRLTNGHYVGEMVIPDTHYVQKEITNRRYEIRVHCAAWLDPSAWVFQKRVHDDGDNQLTWNHHTGGRFITVDNPTDPLHGRIRDSVKTIMRVLGYQFGAVDFIIQNPGTRGQPLEHFFIEFNLAPGWTLERIQEWYHNTFKLLENLTVDDINFMKEGAQFSDTDRFALAEVLPPEDEEVDIAEDVPEEMPTTARQWARLAREFEPVPEHTVFRYATQPEIAPEQVEPAAEEVDDEARYDAVMEEAAMETNFCHNCGRAISGDIFGIMPRFCPGCGTRVRA
jgi:hypothetical protein